MLPLRPYAELLEHFVGRERSTMRRGERAPDILFMSEPVASRSTTNWVATTGLMIMRNNRLVQELWAGMPYLGDMGESSASLYERRADRKIKRSGTFYLYRYDIRTGPQMTECSTER